MDDEKIGKKRDFENNDKIKSIVEDKTQISIDNNPDKKFKTSEFKKTVKKNPWVIATIILAILSFILLILMLRGGITGNIITGRVIGGEDAGNKLIDYLNTKTNGGVEYISYEDMGSIYEVIVLYQGQEIPVYITKDGKYFVQGAVPITSASDTSTSAEEVPKSDKPKVEAFIFSYCPYGLQFEKALIPVYDLLKNSADIDIIAIGAMHGEFEKTETLRQISIEQLYGKDKLFEYLKEFATSTDIGSCNGKDTCLEKYLLSIYSKLDMDKIKIEDYMKTSASKIYVEQNARAKELGISGSPTFVINDVKVQVTRSPDAIKQAICNAFNAPPNECSQTLSTSAASAGFSASGNGGSSTGEC